MEWKSPFHKSALIGGHVLFYFTLRFRFMHRTPCKERIAEAIRPEFFY